MRFVRLEVSSFQSVKSAVVEFGPGLNLLYGPNDLGKSTLARAIRAALLVAPTSAEAEAFHPWHADDEKATVTLDFVDDEGRFWRVKKAFGSPTGSQLWFSKDGHEWVADSRAREVDEKLRTLLPWGIAAPGGKKRGLPQSFLTNALLGEQDEVESILAAGLDGDQADSGRVALTKALSALAQDPMVKRVLLVAQREFDRFFTEKGRRKTGQASAITAASEAVKKLQVERAELAGQLEESSNIEARARALRARQADLSVELDAANARLELAKLDSKLKLVADAVAAVGVLASEAEAKQALVGMAESARSAAEAAVKSAEAALAEVSSADGAKKRELERAQLEAKISKLNDERRRLEVVAEKASAAAKAQAELTKARGEVTRFAASAAKLGESVAASVAAVKDTEGELALAEGIVAYGRWRVASDAAASAAGARAEALALGSEALKKQVEAQQHDSRARAASDEAEAKQAVLPSAAQLAELKRLAQQREVAEAALGGGVTVTVRPRHATALTFVTDDDAAVEEVGLKTEKIIDAEKRVKLSFGDLVDVEIAAGAPEKRRTAEVLKRRWREEGQPVLEKAGAAGLADIDGMLAGVAKLVATANEARAAANRARADAEALRGKAGVLEKQGPAPKEALEEKEARIGALPRDVLAQFFADMGDTWETQCENLRAKTSKTLAERKATLAELERKVKEAEYSVQDAKRREADAAAMLPALVKAIGGDDVAAVQARVAKELTANAAAMPKVTELETEAASGLEAAKQAVVVARQALESRSAEVKKANAALEQARAQLHTRQGEVAALRVQAEGVDRAAVAARVVGPVGDVPTSEREVARLQSTLDEVREAFHKADGALTSSQGGSMAKERVQALDDAILTAQRRERELSIDAESWKLLRDALREAENTESAHLGKALGGAVGAQFSALTGGKYAGVALNQQLKTEAIVMNGVQTSGESILGALSVGTRDQLATLVRLTVASELKTAIVLDDQLVHTDTARLGWFAQLLRKVGESSQVLVFTCRPQDYLLNDTPTRSINLAKLIRRAARV